MYAVLQTGAVYCKGDEDCARLDSRTSHIIYALYVNLVLLRYYKKFLTVSGIISSHRPALIGPENSFVLTDLFDQVSVLRYSLIVIAVVREE